MILPTKHIRYSESILGFGGYVLKLLSSEQTIDQLWYQYIRDFNNGKYPSKHSFDNLFLTLTFLYSINLIKENNGGISICD